MYQAQQATPPQPDLFDPTPNPTPKPTQPPHLTVQIPPPTLSTIRTCTLMRRYQEDRADIDLVFRANRTLLNPRFLHEPTSTIASYIYCHDYTITRQLSFVLENGAGTVVGYVCGAPSTPEYARRIPLTLKYMYKKVEPEAIMPPPNYLALGMPEPTPDDGGDLGRYILHMAARRPNMLFGASVLGLWQKWPAHLQINILPEYQRQGWGRVLVEIVVGELRREGVRGVHLAVHAENRGAEEFFTKLGFGRYQGVLDGGASGEMGRTGGDDPMVYLVKELW